MTNTFSNTRFQSVRSLRGATPIAILAAAACLLSGQASQARAPLETNSDAYVAKAEKKNDQLMAMAASTMRSRRVLMVLPTRVGENWKAAPDFTSTFLRQTDGAVRRALTGTNRYSTLEVRRFNPVLMRAVQDGAVTSDDLNTLLSQPTTPNASAILSKLTFTSAPMQAFVEPANIASFVLDGMTMTDNSLSVKLTGRLYSANGQTLLRSLSATTTVPYSTDGVISSAAKTAATISANRVVSEFVRVPSATEAVNGEQPLVIAPSSSTEIVPDMNEPVKTKGGVVLPGKPIRGSSSSSSLPGVGVGGTATMPPGGITTVIEVPSAEKFPDAAPAGGVTPGTETPTENTDTTNTPPVVDGDSGSATATPEATTAGGDTTAGTDTTEPAVPDTASTMSDTTNPTTPEGGDVATTPSTATNDGSSPGGITSDGSTSAGTVGASSTESHPNVRPIPTDDGLDLAFEY